MVRVNFNLDMGLVKRFSITERQTLEFRGEAFNIPNKAGFVIGDQDINSTNFGRITGVNIGSRLCSSACTIDSDAVAIWPRL